MESLVRMCGRPDAPLAASAALPDEGEVHVWSLPLCRPPESIGILRDYLTPDELARAERFVFPQDRDSFIAARGQLRAILARYLGRHPREVRFAYGAHGKPHLLAPTGIGALTFNLSHTRGLGLCAVARGRQVGVDIELVRPEVDIAGIARSTFSSAEQARLAALPPSLRVSAFYACWTRKEAYIKARGDGLSYPLDAFDVSLGPEEPPCLLRSREGAEEQRRWSFHAIDPGRRYAAALVLERPSTRSRQRGLRGAHAPPGGECEYR